MIKLSSESDQVCVAKAAEAGQEHLFDAWDTLAPDERRRLLGAIQSVDFQWLQRLVRKHLLEREVTDAPVVHPPRIDPLPSGPENSERAGELRRLGEAAIAAGKIGIVAVPGASGARIGGPVSLVPVGPVSGKTVLQLHAERVRALNLRHRVSLRWWIVPESYGTFSTPEWLRENGYFGLPASDVVFVEPMQLPLVDRRGKIVLADRATLALDSIGHGGVFLEFLKKERLEEFRSRGIEHLFFFQIDNPMARIADPVFLGHHIESGFEISSKAVRRTSEDEEVGVFCADGSAIRVIEYGEIADEERTLRTESGELAYAHGNMATHAISVDFLARMAEEKAQLPVHTRERIQPCLGKKGRKSRPTTPNCIQFRVFLFDAIQLASRSSVVECDRASEFSPIRNASGEMSPQTAQRDLSREWTTWLEIAGATFSGGQGAARVTAEICPLYALDAGELDARLDLPFEVGGVVHLGIGGRS